jgi:TonB family protein
MKVFLFLFSSAICFSINGLAQDTIEKRFYKTENYNSQPDIKKAKFVEFVIKNQDSSLTYEFRGLIDNRPVKIWHYKNNIPVGQWKYYNNKGMEISTVNYNCDSLYNDKVYSNILHYNFITKKPEEKIEGIFEPPVFSDGSVGIQEFIMRKLIYPPEAAENGIYGNVMIQCILNENGKLSDITIYKSAHKFLDLNSLETVKRTPDWKPAKLNGVPVKVCIMISTSYVLQ